MMQDEVFQKTSLQTLTQEGEKFYLDHLRSELEEKNLGDFVIIEPETKRYFLDEDLLKALQKAEKEFPDKFFTIIKVGTFKPPINTFKAQGSHAWAFQ